MYTRRKKSRETTDIVLIKRKKKNTGNIMRVGQDRDIRPARARFFVTKLSKLKPRSSPWRTRGHMSPHVIFFSFLFFVFYTLKHDSKPPVVNDVITTLYGPVDNKIRCQKYAFAPTVTDRQKCSSVSLKV